MSDAFEEVEENLRRDQYMDWLRRYGLWAGLALVLLLAAIGGWRFYGSWRLSQAGAYAQKLEDGKKLFISKDLLGAERYYTDMAKDAPGVYKAAALEFAAEALYEQGDKKGALAHLDDAAKAATDKLMADDAKLKAAYVAADLQDYKTVEPRLMTLVNDGGPLSFEAREVLGAKAYEAGDLSAAREQFNFLSLALDAPQGVRQRAQGALALLGPEPSAKPGAAK